MKTKFARFAFTAVVGLAAGCAPTTVSRQSPSMLEIGRLEIPDTNRSARLNEDINAILTSHGIVAAGVGMMRNGDLAWSAYFGEERPGVPTSSETRFNVASITKTVMAETVLRLADKGFVDLDEPMYEYWVDPDLAEDSRHRLLTPRLVLAHRTGLPNWRFGQEGGKLAFVRDPDTGYGYSGEGFEYLGRFLERKLGKPFPEIVDEQVMEPLGLDGPRVAVDLADAERIPWPAAVDGKVPALYCRPDGWCRKDGTWSAADDMTTTLPDYARILGAISDNSGYSADLAALRDTIVTDKGDERVVDCGYAPDAACPRTQGYGLGFNIVDYGNVSAIGHGGSDWSELAIAYAWQPSGDGVIIFLDGLNESALEAMPEILERLDPLSPYLNSYRRWLAARRATNE